MVKYLAAFHQLRPDLVKIVVYDFPECTFYGHHFMEAIRNFPYVMNMFFMNKHLDGQPLPDPTTTCKKDHDATLHFYISPPETFSSDAVNDFPFNRELAQLDCKFNTVKEIFDFFKAVVSEDNLPLTSDELDTAILARYDGIITMMLNYYDGKLYEFREAASSPPFRKLDSDFEYLGRELTCLDLVSVLRELNLPWVDVSWTHLICLQYTDQHYDWTISPWSQTDEDLFEKANPL